MSLNFCCLNHFVFDFIITFIRLIHDMKNIRRILSLLFCCTFLSVMGQDRDISAFLDTVQLRPYTASMHSMTQIRVFPSDSIYIKEYNEVRYFNTDTLFHYLATRGYGAVEDEMYYYYYDIVAYMSPSQAEREVRKVRRIARQYHDADINFESKFLALYVKLDMEDAEEYGAVMDDMYHLAQKEAAHGNVRNEIYLLRFIFNVSYLRGYYARAFRFAKLTADRLDQVTDEQYLDRKATYFMVGNAYHAFRDYNRSIPYLKASLREDGSRHMADRANLRARYNLGNYYASVGDLEQSDFYFLSMWNSPDQVKMRPYYDMSALTGLAINAMKRGKIETSLRVLRLCFAQLHKESFFSLSVRVALYIAECYLAKGDGQAARCMLDSCQVMMKNLEDEKEARHYYTLENRYYTRLGQVEEAQCYLDSALSAYSKHEDKYNTLVILRAEQELFEAEKALRKQQLLHQQTVIQLTVVGLILLAGTLLFILYLYRKKHAAYHQLVLRTQEWAAQMEVALPVKSAEVGIDDLVLMEAIGKLMEEEKIYTDAELNVETLATRLGVNRNAISKAVNSTQQKNFTAFINDYRIREAIRLLSDPVNDRLTTDAIATDSGFNSRETFYRAFKSRTGITPTQFRKNRN